jgi:hypothetical protein
MTMRRVRKRKRREITPSLQPPPPKDLPSLGDLFSRQAGISVGAPRQKRPQTGLLALIKRRFYAPTY